jgi:organic radical activating enzyme
MQVSEVLEIVEKDALFYRNSGGGITASGGEPTTQPAFLLELFKGCQKRGFHTALDTCGIVRWDVLKEILEYTDLVLFDIKHMDPMTHTELTGVDNRLILENAKRIVKQEKDLRVRIPLIPGCGQRLYAGRSRVISGRAPEGNQKTAEVTWRQGVNRLVRRPIAWTLINKMSAVLQRERLDCLASFRLSCHLNVFVMESELTTQRFGSSSHA